MREMTLDQALARRRDARAEVVDVDEPTLKLVIFELGDEWYAFHGHVIREILAHTRMFPVPGSPPSLEGVINVRGDIESVIRLDERLRLPASRASRSDETGVAACILLGRGGVAGTGISSGIHVDRVVDVVDLPQSSIQPPPPTLPEHMRELVAGVLRFKERAVVLLDIDRLFADYVQGIG